MAPIDYRLWLRDMTLATALIIMMLCGIFAMMPGCGAAAQQHSALNTVARAANPTYDLAIEACDEAELAIIARPDSSYMRDAEDILTVRSVCDRIFAGFDALRLAHRVARRTVDEGAQGAVAEAMSRLMEAWAALQALVPELLGQLGGA